MRVKPSTDRRFAALSAAGACLFGTSLSISGCTVGPEYVPPDLPLPSEFAAGSGAQAQRNEDLACWWRVLDAPALEHLIGRALTANPDIEAAVQRIRQARAARRIAFSGLLPTLDMSASGRRSGVEQSAGDSSLVITSAGGGVASANRDSSSNERNLFEIGLDAAWELDVFGGQRRAVEAASADVASSTEQLHDIRVTLAAEVAQAFITLQSLEEQLTVLRKNQDVATNTASIAEKRFAAGFNSLLDVSSARAEVASITAQVPVVEASVRQQRFALNVLLGRPPESDLPETETPAPLADTPPGVPAGTPSDLVRRRPDIRRADADLHAATARVGVATADLFPHFSLSAFLGVQGSSVSALDSWKNTLWNFGGSAAQPVFEGGRLLAERERAEAARAEQAAVYRRAVLSALEEVESSYVAYAAQRARSASLRTALAENRRAFGVATKLYIEGVGEYLSVLTAQRAALNAEQQLVQAKTEAYTSLIALYKALGGGWSSGENASGQ